MARNRQAAQATANCQDERRSSQLLNLRPALADGTVTSALAGPATVPLHQRAPARRLCVLLPPMLVTRDTLCLRYPATCHGASVRRPAPRHLETAKLTPQLRQQHPPRAALGDRTPLATLAGNPPGTARARGDLSRPARLEQAPAMHPPHRWQRVKVRQAAYHLIEGTHGDQTGYPLRAPVCPLPSGTSPRPAARPQRPCAVVLGGERPGRGRHRRGGPPRPGEKLAPPPCNRAAGWLSRGLIRAHREPPPLGDSPAVSAAARCYALARHKSGKCSASSQTPPAPRFPRCVRSTAPTRARRPAPGAGQPSPPHRLTGCAEMPVMRGQFREHFVPDYRA